MSSNGSNVSELTQNALALNIDNVRHLLRTNKYEKIALADIVCRLLKIYMNDEMTEIFEMVNLITSIDTHYFICEGPNHDEIFEIFVGMSSIKYVLRLMKIKKTWTRNNMNTIADIAIKNSNFKNMLFALLCGADSKYGLNYCISHNTNNSKTALVISFYDFDNLSQTQKENFHRYFYYGRNYTLLQIKNATHPLLMCSERCITIMSAWPVAGKSGLEYEYMLLGMF